MDKFIYNQYAAEQQRAVEDSEKSKAFLERIKPFKDVTNLSEAKELAARILPVKEDITTFYVGNIKCTVINKENLFRLCIDSPQEFICYNFS